MIFIADNGCRLSCLRWHVNSVNFHLFIQLSNYSIISCLFSLIVFTHYEWLWLSDLPSVGQWMTGVRVKKHLLWYSWTGILHFNLIIIHKLFRISYFGLICFTHLTIINATWQRNHWCHVYLSKASMLCNRLISSYPVCFFGTAVFIPANVSVHWFWSFCHSHTYRSSFCLI